MRKSPVALQAVCPDSELVLRKVGRAAPCHKIWLYRCECLVSRASQGSLADTDGCRWHWRMRAAFLQLACSLQALASSHPTMPRLPSEPTLCVVRVWRKAHILLVLHTCSIKVKLAGPGMVTLTSRSSCAGALDKKHAYRRCVCHGGQLCGWLSRSRKGCNHYLHGESKSAHCLTICHVEKH